MIVTYVIMATVALIACVWAVSIWRFVYGRKKPVRPSLALMQYPRPARLLAVHIAAATPPHSTLKD